jgi:hypothetical protein
MAEEEKGARLSVEGPVGKVYEQIEPLLSDKHAGMGVKRTDAAYAFTQKLHWTPLTTTEIPAAATFYPVVFAGDDKNPIAVMGLRQGQNLFFNENGPIDPDGYVPGFYRRYPFVLASGPDPEQKVVCFDSGSPLISSDTPDLPFFEGKEPTKYLSDSMNFLRVFDAEMERTRRFVDAMNDLELFEKRDVSYAPDQPDGKEVQNIKFAEYFAIPLESLKKLSGEQMAELRDNGSLMLIYAHNISLANWRLVVNRAAREFQQQGGGQQQ